ncbi:MAG: HEAT repeat domain-containing protein, partial [Saprospiraceae bacterium]
MKQKLILCCVSLISLIWACLPPAQENLNDLKYALNDQVYQDIKNFQDRRLTDSLIYFLVNPKAVYRMLSAEALGSYRDTNAIQELIKLLKDPNESVKQAAIFSLGQIGHQSAERSLINSFIAVDSTGPYLETNVMILEALGKCGTDSTLNLICKIQNYQKSNQTLLEGQMLCFFRFGLRNKICPASTALLVQVATTKSNSESARLIASHCLLRFKELNIKPHYKELRNACFEEKNASIRMCLIAAFARITTPETLSDLEELYTRIFDNRIQCNLVRGLQNFPNGMASSLAKKALQN